MNGLRVCVFPRRAGAETTQSYSKTWVLYVQVLGRPLERPLQVGPQVLDVLEADRQAEQPGRDASGFPAGSALHRRMCAAEARRVQDQLRRGLDRARVGDVERDHAAEAGITDGRDGGMLLEPPRELARGLRVPGHPLVERLEPAQEGGGGVGRR